MNRQARFALIRAVIYHNLDIEKQISKNPLYTVSQKNKKYDSNNAATARLVDLIISLGSK